MSTKVIKFINRIILKFIILLKLFFLFVFFIEK